jgi:Tfp pilus assembly protein PilX
MKSRTFRKGSVLITAIIFVVIFTVLTVGLAAISDDNLQIADNQREANRAFASAESGLNVMRHWLSRVAMPSTTAPEDYFSTAVAELQSDLTASGANVVVNADGSIPEVTLDVATAQSFSGQLSADPCDPTILRLVVSGSSRNMSRTIRVDFSIEPYRFPIFNYGIATKGALQFPNNPTLTGATENWEADIYIESAGDILALEVGGNTNFDGNIDIGNPLGVVDFQGDVQIGGDTGQTAIDNHIEYGAEPVEFPVPDTSHFQTYATGGNLDPSALTAPGVTLTNVVIPPGMNPTFEGNVIVEGVLFIEQPNIVTFGGNLQLHGVIVGDGDPAAPGTNAINFEGNFASTTYPADPQFDAIRQEQGSSILAPGFGVSFTGNFATVDGVLAASSMYFSANASATVKGTMMSYSEDATRVEGNVSLSFDRADAVEIPAGFDLLRVLEYEPRSYAMVY